MWLQGIWMQLSRNTTYFENDWCNALADVTKLAFQYCRLKANEWARAAEYCWPKTTKLVFLARSFLNIRFNGCFESWLIAFSSFVFSPCVVLSRFSCERKRPLPPTHPPCWLTKGDTSCSLQALALKDKVAFQSVEVRSNVSFSAVIFSYKSCQMSSS